MSKGEGGHMGVFEKLKNVFFEEEYVEVEEPVRKKIIKEPVAKKVELPEIKKKKDKAVESEISNEEVINKKPIEVADKAILEQHSSNSFKFPMNFEEEDFKNDEVYHKEVKKEAKETVKEDKPKIEEKMYESNFTGLYEGNLEAKKKAEFRPTPIISPIYGILDKNYKKDEIVTKKEIRISSSPKNVDLDTVREKAYGDLASDITASMYEDSNDDIDTEEGDDKNLLYDLNEESSPAVTKVTVGDAEEYYNDLGLEYNIDYKDNTKEKATGRRTKIDNNCDENNETANDREIEQPVVEDNLFDLIDSMYEDKE